MPMMDTVFSSVGRHDLSSLLTLVTTTDIFPHFFLDFSKNICESSFLVLLPLKSSDQMFDRLYEEELQIIELIALNSHIITI